jgi:hypothetical protein
MLNLPVGAALEKLQISAMDVKAQPTAVAALLRDLLMRVADRDELELPVLARLVRQRLRLAGDCVDFAPEVADPVNGPRLDVAP